MWTLEARVFPLTSETLLQGAWVGLGQCAGSPSHGTEGVRDEKRRSAPGFGQT